MLVDDSEVLIADLASVTTSLLVYPLCLTAALKLKSKEWYPSSHVSYYTISSIQRLLEVLAETIPSC